MRDKLEAAERYRLKQDGIPVAWADGPGAENLIRHYALIYGQDGPVIIEQHRQGRWRPALLASKENDNG